MIHGLFAFCWPTTVKGVSILTKNPYANYSNQKVFTASKEELLIMLYDGAIKFANQALMAIEAKDTQKAHNLIGRVQDIVREFQVTLDRKYPIAENLSALYDYMYSRLVTANIKKDPAPLEEVRDMLKELRETWKQAAELSKTQNSPTASFKQASAMAR